MDGGCRSGKSLINSSHTLIGFELLMFHLLASRCLALEMVLRNGSFAISRLYISIQCKRKGEEEKYEDEAEKRKSF